MQVKIVRFPLCLPFLPLFPLFFLSSAPPPPSSLSLSLSLSLCPLSSCFGRAEMRILGATPAGKCTRTLRA